MDVRTSGSLLAGRCVPRSRALRRGRRAHAAFALICAVGMVLCSGVPGPLLAAGARAVGGRPVGPNIVFVLTDDLAKNLVRYMPHIRAMERRGVTFRNYTVTNSLCCPSRASILTGRYPHDTKIFENLAEYGGGFPRFQREGEEDDTFAVALRDAGYRTALMGKYLNGYAPRPPGTASYVPPGWTEWDVTGGAGYDEYDYVLTHDHQSRRYGTAPSDYLTTVLDKRAQGFIARSAAAQQPFFLEVSTYSPHGPSIPAPADVGRFRRVRAPRPLSFDRLPTRAPGWLRGRQSLTASQIHRIDVEFRQQVRCVQSIDRMIGDLHEAVRQAGLAQRTIFVFSSDNGLHLGEHRLPNGKLSAFDTDITVPLVFAGAGVDRRRRVNSITQSIDLAPTFESLTGAAVSGDRDRDGAVDGRSLVPLLSGRPPPNWPTLALVEQHREPRNKADPDYSGPGTGYPPSYRAIRSATFTYVQYITGFREYYDRRADPAELHNIARSLPPRRIARLDRELRALSSCHGTAACDRARYARRP